MTTNLNDISRMMIANHYRMPTLADLRSYLIDELFIRPSDDITDRDILIAALDCDIADALHNANLDFYLYPPHRRPRDRLQPPHIRPRR